MALPSLFTQARSSAASTRPPLASPHESGRWGSYACWKDLLRSHLVELSSHTSTGGSISLAAGWVAEAQRYHEPVVWIQPEGGALYPPDLAACGVCLDSLVIIHARRGDTSNVLQAAEILLRTGSVGLIVVDATHLSLGSVSFAWQGRLAAIAREQRSGVLILTRKEKCESSLGPLISLHIRATYDCTLWPFSKPKKPSQSQQIPEKYFSIYAEATKNKLGLSLSPQTWSRSVPQDWPCLL